MSFVSACHHTSKISVRPYLFITHVITDGIELHSDLSPLLIFARSVANFFIIHVKFQFLIKPISAVIHLHFQPMKFY